MLLRGPVLYLVDGRPVRVAPAPSGSRAPSPLLHAYPLPPVAARHEER